MKLIDRKNELMVLSAILLIFLFFMAFSLSQNTSNNYQVPIEKESHDILDLSHSDDISELQKELDETALTDLDKELSLIESELESAY